MPWIDISRIFVAKWPYIFFIGSANCGSSRAFDVRGRGPGPVGRGVRAGAGRPRAGGPVPAGHGGGHAGRPGPSRHAAGREPARRSALGRRRARPGLRRPAHAVDHARQRGLRADGPGDGRRAARLLGRGGDDARRLVSLVEVKLDPGGSWLLDGQFEAEIHTSRGAILRASQQFPPGSRARPRPRPSCGPSWPTACAGLTPTQRRGPGKTRQAYSGGSFPPRRGSEQAWPGSEQAWPGK